MAFSIIQVAILEEAMFSYQFQATISSSFSFLYPAQRSILNYSSLSFINLRFFKEFPFPFQTIIYSIYLLLIFVMALRSNSHSSFSPLYSKEQLIILLWHYYLANSYLKEPFSLLSLLIFTCYLQLFYCFSHCQLQRFSKITVLHFSFSQINQTGSETTVH